VTGPDNVVPLPRPGAEQQADRINTALGILGWRPWCDACRPHAKQVAEALTGVSLEDLAQQHADASSADGGGR
jgi:hypothetical protein